MKPTTCHYCLSPDAFYRVWPNAKNPVRACATCLDRLIVFGGWDKTFVQCSECLELWNEAYTQTCACHDGRRCDGCYEWEHWESSCYPSPEPKRGGV